MSGHHEDDARTASRAGRVPPGQHVTQRFPVLQAGDVHHVSRAGWTLRLTGLVEPHRTLCFADLLSLPATHLRCDLHCVTRWTKLDTRWRGVRCRQLLTGLRLDPAARHVVLHAPDGWTTNLPVEEFLRDDVLVAYEYEGQPLTDEHGGPARLLVPRLYLWKSAKWLEAIEFTADERLGYWESLGYHPLGDPWLEQRYA